MSEVDRTQITTIHGGDPEQVRAQHAQEPVGQHADYIVLTEAERAKGFVRPVRNTYVHVGQRPRYPIRPLTPEERAENVAEGYVAYEGYPESESPAVGRYWTEAQLHSGCQTETRMGTALAETYARDPKFYGATFCYYCNAHFPVGEHGEFVWTDGARVGT